jgi:tetratricopeptide (TPR) repeat protein
MTPAAARKILGLGPDEEPRPRLAEFKRSRERIAGLVRAAPDSTAAAGYRSSLTEYDRALAALLDSHTVAEIVTPSRPAAQTLMELFPATSGAPAVNKPRRPAASARHHGIGWFVWLLVVLTGFGGAGLYYDQHRAGKQQQAQVRVAFLERQAAAYIESRRWPEATRAYEEIDALAPGLPRTLLGRESIKVGMAEEQTQFIAYWSGQASAELDAGRIDEAQAAIQRVLEKFPADKEALAIAGRITAARAGQVRAAAIAGARKNLVERRWDAAIAAARQILVAAPNDADAHAILAEADAAMAKHAADQVRAKELLDQATARDHGQFDAQALDWLHEAAALAPDNAAIAAKLEKLASYARTLKVPGDFATPAAALAAARHGDRVVLSEQTWPGALVVNAAIDLQGAGSAKTIVECPATVGCAITLGPEAKSVRISGITFRHPASHTVGTERFSAALVRGSSATFVDCQFSDASGHGLMVIEQGTASASHCRFSNNGWDGAAVSGPGCALEVRESEALDNLEHGIEAWDGAALTLVNNRCEGNSRNGVHADSGAAAATLEGNQLVANREFGLVLDSAAAGKITGNTARANLLGGIAIRASAAAVPVTSNQITHNEGPGLVLEAGLAAAAYEANTLTDNATQQVLAGANLSPQPEPVAAEPAAETPKPRQKPPGSNNKPGRKKR